MPHQISQLALVICQPLECALGPPLWGWGSSLKIHLGGACQPSPLDAPGQAPWPGSCLLVGFAFYLMACDCPCEEPGDGSGLISVQGLECKCSRAELGWEMAWSSWRVCGFAQTFVNDLLQGGPL